MTAATARKISAMTRSVAAAAGGEAAVRRRARAVGRPVPERSLAIEVAAVRKTFGRTRAVEDVSFEIRRGAESCSNGVVEFDAAEGA